MYIFVLLRLCLFDPPPPALDGGDRISAPMSFKFTICSVLNPPMSIFYLIESLKNVLVFVVTVETVLLGRSETLVSGGLLCLS